MPFWGRQTVTLDEDLFILSAMNLANFLFSSTVVRINETFNSYTVVSDGTRNRTCTKFLEITEDRIAKESLCP